MSTMYYGVMASRIPECFLIQNLQEKSNQRRDIKFNYLSELERFAKRVSGEIRQINELFPEYTPHDEEYHISRLFHVADKVLGQHLISELNTTELFVLACSLLGHDWGMAVSQTERQAIIQGYAKSSDEFSLLLNEAERFQQFLIKHSSTLKGANNEIPIELWREYVRQTHAPRSGQRVKRYLESLGGGLGEAIARVCEGDWVDFEVLHDYRLYPQDFSVLGESVNLRALAVYVRLIDLLDIADDRTPFAIWKFVNPMTQYRKWSGQNIVL